MGVVAVDGLQTVVVANDDDVAIVGVVTREAHHAVEHGLHGIALRGDDGQTVVATLLGLAHGQGEGIFFGAKKAHLYAERVRLCEEIWGGYAYLLLLGCRKLVLGGSKGRQGHDGREEQDDCSQFHFFSNSIQVVAKRLWRHPSIMMAL